MADDHFTLKSCANCGDVRLLSDFKPRRRWCLHCFNHKRSEDRKKLPPPNPNIIKRCSTCKESKPETDFSRGCFSCKPCGALASKNYRQRNPAKRRATAIKWAKNNPDKIKAQSRRGYTKRKDYILTYFHAYYYAHHDKYLRAAKTYRQTHPEARRVHHQNRKARKAELPATFTVEEAAFCRAYFHYACAICDNEEGFQWTIALDHWIPLKANDCPGTIAANMIPLCHGMGGCNNSKKHYAPRQWLTSKFGKRKAAQILKRINAYFAVVRMRFP